jgi:hypothetical protein
MSDLSPLSGEERKLDFGTVRSVDDPTETLGRARRNRGSEPIREEDRNVAEFKPEQQ